MVMMLSLMALYHFLAGSEWYSEIVVNVLKQP